MNKWRFFICTFGCKVNQYESQSVREAWSLHGGEETKTPQNADVILVNSCAVTGKAERDARNALLSLRRKAPSALLLISGCSAELAGEKIFSPGERSCIIPNAHKAVLLGNPLLLPDELPLFKGYQPFGIKNFQRSRPVLKIQDGCSRHCAYCIVPLKRGPSVSRSPQSVIEEAETLIEAGFRELIISGINLAQYGRDLSPRLDFWDLAELLDGRLAEKWAGKVRLRISSIDPKQLDAKAVRVLSFGKLFCPHLHLSLQSGSEKILRLMGRGDQKTEIMLESLSGLRKFWPILGLGADILVGFPGETEQDVQATVDIIQKTGLHYAHVFPFAARPGTPAGSFPGRLPHAEKLLRAAAMRQITLEQGQGFMRGLVGRSLNIVVDGSGGKKAVNEFYAACELATPLTGARISREIIRARAVELKNGTLIVEP